MCSVLELLFQQEAQKHIHAMFIDEIANAPQCGPELKTDTPSHIPQYRIKNVHMFYEWVARSQVSPVMSTYGALVAVYLSDNIRSMVINKSRADRSMEYFRRFNDRMELYICGIPLKSKNDAIQSKTPTELVLHEWLYFTKLSHRFP